MKHKKGNYFHTEIANSQYLQVSIQKIIGHNHGNESFLTLTDIKQMAEKLDSKILTAKILRNFVWFYNLHVSKDTRCNIDIKILKKELQYIKANFCNNK